MNDYIKSAVKGIDLIVIYKTWGVKDPNFRLNISFMGWVYEIVGTQDYVV